MAINTHNKDNNESIGKEEDILKGTFYYSDSVKYEFTGKGKGAMYDGDTKYEYTYTINDNKMTIDFENEAVHDAKYTFNLEDDTLTLIGGEGTTGGEYILKKGE